MEPPSVLSLFGGGSGAERAQAGYPTTNGRAEMNWSRLILTRSTFEAAVKTLDQCVSIAEDVLRDFFFSSYCRKPRTELGHTWIKRLQKTFFFFLSYIGYSRTPLYSFRSNQNLYLFFFSSFKLSCCSQGYIQPNATSVMHFPFLRPKHKTKTTCKNDVFTRSF